MALNLIEGTASRTSSSLLRSARANDPDAWQRVVDCYSRRIYRWCRKARLAPEDASDVVQEVFRSVAQKLVDFHHDQNGDTFRGWLYTITHNKVRDYVSKRPGRLEFARGGTDAQLRFQEIPESQSSESSWSPRIDAARTVENQLIQRVRAECSERDWLVFWRVAVDGQTSQEVGEQFQMSGNAVRLVKMRILRRFREVSTLATPTVV